MSNTPYRQFLIEQVRESEMLEGCLFGTNSDNPEYARGIAELIAVLSPLQDGEDGISAAVENILPQLYPPVELAEWEKELLRGWSFRQGANGTGYITRARNLDGRFDLGDAFDAIRESTGWQGVVLLSTTYWTNGEETGWWGADEVRWHFQQY